MIPRAVIQNAEKGDLVLYRDREDLTWYSGIITGVQRYDKRSITGAIDTIDKQGYLEIEPTDTRSIGPRVLCDLTDVAYVIPEGVLTGEISDEQVRKVLDSAVPISDESLSDEIMKLLGELRDNYVPYSPETATE